MLAELTRRLANDAGGRAGRGDRQLAEITRLRVERLVDCG